MERWEHRDFDRNAVPYMTAEEMQNMPNYKSRLFLEQPNIWRWDGFILRNCAHPDNLEWWARDLVQEAMRANGR